MGNQPNTKYGHSPSSALRTTGGTYIGAVPVSTTSPRYGADTGLWLPGDKPLSCRGSEDDVQSKPAKFNVTVTMTSVHFDLPGGRWKMNKANDDWWHVHKYNASQHPIHHGKCMSCGAELPEGFKPMAQLQKLRPYQRSTLEEFMNGRIKTWALPPIKCTYPILKREIVIAKS